MCMYVHDLCTNRVEIAQMYGIACYAFRTDTIVPDPDGYSTGKPVTCSKAKKKRRKGRGRNVGKSNVIKPPTKSPTTWGVKAAAPKLRWALNGQNNS